MAELPIQLIERLESSKRLVFFTGAGMSAESGIPTFRGEDGIWKKFKPEELANFNAFRKNPELVWEWYKYRREIISNTRPNPGHLAIAELEKYYSVEVITQNVDNLHRRAGSKIIYELHGNIEKNYCIKCNKRYDFFDFKLIDNKNICECGGFIRPDVVWFGENLPLDQFNNGEEAAKWSDILFVVGTSAVVYPAAYIPYEAKKAGSFLVEINLDETEISSICDINIFGKAGETLSDILSKVKQIKGE